MPHFGLMDAWALGPERAALEQARLHIRAGRRRLREGKISAGLVTLYDAFTCAMEWNALAPGRRKALDIRDGDDLRDDRDLFRVLVRSGVIEKNFDFEGLHRLIDRALDDELSGYDHGGVVGDLEQAMTRLGVLPFDESELPPEDPSTF